MKRKYFFLAFLLLLFSVNSKAEKVNAIMNDTVEYFFSEKDFDVLPDPDGKYSIKYFCTPEGKQLFGNSTIDESYVYNCNNVWYRFSFINESTTNHHYYFELLNFRIDSVNFFYQVDDCNFQEIKTGDYLKFKSKPIGHKNFIFPIPSGKLKDTTTFYIKIYSSRIGYKRVSSFIRSDIKLIPYALSEYYFFGIFYGIIIMILLFNFFLYLKLRSSIFIYYLAYIGSVLFYSLSWNGLGFQYLWPNYPAINNFALPLSITLFVVFVLLYTKAFFYNDISENTFKKIFNILIFVRLFYFFYETLIGYFFIPVEFIDVFALIYCVGIAIYFFFKNYHPTKYFLIGYISLILGFLFVKAIQIGLIKTGINHFENRFFSLLLIYGIEFGVILELLFFTIALTERYRYLNVSNEESLNLVIQQLKINEELKEKVNRELEIKVEQRTEELKEANEKLKEQAKQITEMNLVLDKDNHNLKKNIKDLHSARIFVKKVNFEEFNKLYPTEESCYQFLSTLKWEEGFICKKCKNDKFFWGKTAFAHRCTKCGYEESTTSNTIFHNMRIPINKAFYLIFLVFSTNEKVTTVELAKLLGLRQKTCWHYKKNISERIATKKKFFKKENLDGWDSLILD